MRARLVLSAAAPGTVSFDFISLVPKKTFKDHGLRIDLAEMLRDLRPGFMRFPGGCWVEGQRMEFAQRWKTTIGDPALRRTQHNLWGYMVGNGLGYHEYLQFCEDIGAAALFVVNCGMSHEEIVPLDKMGPFVAGRPGRHRVCHRSPEQHVGQAAGQGRPPRPVPPQVRRDRQRERRSALQRAISALLRRHQGEISAHPPRGQ